MNESLFPKIIAWLVPALLTAAVSFLWGIQNELRRISESLAVATVRIEWTDRRVENHEQRLGTLERRKP